MSRARIGYLVALIVAVLVLLGSVVGAAARSSSPVRADRQVGDDRGPGGWMRGDRTPGGRGSMMGPGAGRTWQQPGARPTPRPTPSATS